MPRRETPLDEDAGELVAFAAGLRKLRAGAGDPTYRELSRRAHFSAAALSEAANGRKLPSLAVTVAYVRACGGDVAEWEARWRALAVADRPPDLADTDAPYVGLRAFQARDADRFFGRERLVAAIRELVGRQRLVGVFGASGSGKSSVLRAGVAAAAPGPVVVFTPGAAPVRELAERVGAWCGKPAAALEREFSTYRENLHLRVRQALATESDDLLLVVDQFEELFTLCHDDGQREAFVAALVTAATAPGSRTRVVLGVRADFLGHCGRHPELVEALHGGQVLVGPMSADELRRAIVQPALAVRCTVENALVTRLVADAAGQPAALPLLSHALLETWKRRRGVALTLDAYDQTGGLEHAVARSAEAVHAGLSEADQEVARWLFLRLIAVGEGTEDTKRRVPRAELDRPGAAEVLAVLAEHRLVVVDRDTVEPAHEALIRGWPRLRGWIAENRAGLRVQRMLTEAARAWTALDHDGSALLRGTRLALAREWAAGRDAELTPVEARFLAACVAAEDAVHTAERRRTRRLRQVVALLAVLLLLATGAVGYAWQAQRAATEARNAALVREVVGVAEAMRTTDPALAAQLALAAHRLAPSAQTRAAVLGAAGGPGTALIPADAEAVRAVDAAAGRLVVVADDAATLWDIREPHRPTRSGRIDGVSAAVLSPDGTLLAAKQGINVLLWDLADAAQPKEVARTESRDALSLAFRSDGTRVLIGTDKGLYDWDASAPDRPTRLLDPGADVLELRTATPSRVLAREVVDRAEGRAARLSLRPADGGPAVVLSDDFSGDLRPDGRVAATWGPGPVRLWDVADPATPRLLHTLASPSATSVAFSSDGATMATADTDGTTRLWNLTDPAHPKRIAALAGETTRQDQLVLDNGVLVAWNDARDTVRVVDVRDAVANHTATGVEFLGFSPRGDLAVLGLADGSFRLHRMAGPRRLGGAVPLDAPVGRVGPDQAVTAAFSPDARLVVTSVGAHQTTAWDVTDPDRPVRLATVATGLQAAYGVAFSPDGRFLVGGDITGTVTVRQTGTWQAVWHHALETSGIGLPVLSPVFTPAGDTVVVGHRRHGVMRFSRPDWREDPGTSNNSPLEPGVMAFDRNDNLVVAAGRDGLWLAPGSGPGQPDTRLGDASATTVAVAGDLVAAVGGDHRIRLWRTTGRGAAEEVTVLPRRTDTVEAAAFTPDGHTLATAGADGTIHFQETGLDRAAALICATAQPRITADQWARHLPGLPYEPPCPNA
ncbi:hypothetical protein AB0A74_00510 [Saccharothrix sp. NPDC042600]|uniref:nSTAND1 domain-containing NTPase n=1 Tax=Saccharothrix TaxID=2071 RepID=UPI0033F78A1E|nr:hypothetical protein GCM10017745_47860 [Saccharothrix mutabilis subsp. capreolus]